jgi:glucose/arabinose dehydrogenase
MQSQGVVRWVSVVFCGLLLAGFGSVEAALKMELVASGLVRPVFVCSPPGDTNRLFIVEQRPGRIRIFDRAAGTIKSTAFLTAPSVRTGNEEGLLGLAFHPGYRTNGYFYININPNSDPRRTEIVRYQAQGDPATSDVADPASRKLILTFNQPESNHNGGWMAFGPDGYLYISSGDGGGANDVHGTIGNGQSRTTLLGKILRIDIDGADPYAIPQGNPFKDHATYRQEIWAFGLRNPWRCSFDRATGHLWIGDVGQGLREEIDVIPSGLGGLNFGWRPREGFARTPAYNETPVTPAVDPVTDYNQEPAASVTGGYVYRGSAVPELQGKYIFADYITARFWLVTIDPNGTNGTKVEITTDMRSGSPSVDEISSFGGDDQGELYVCDLGGQVYKIVAEGPAAPQIGAVQAEGNEFVITFVAAAGQSYTVESRSPLAGGTWANEQVIASAATNRTVSVTNTLTGTERYFRLRSE